MRIGYACAALRIKALGVRKSGTNNTLPTATARRTLYGRQHDRRSR